jgi:hypothetical protein
LTPLQADANWLTLVWPPLIEKLHEHRQVCAELHQARAAHAALVSGHQEIQAHCASLERVYLQATAALQETQTYCASVERAYLEANATLQAMRAELERSPNLGPTSLAVARMLSNLARRFPAAANAVKRVLRGTKPPP